MKTTTFTLTKNHNLRGCCTATCNMQPVSSPHNESARCMSIHASAMRSRPTPLPLRAQPGEWGPWQYLEGRGGTPHQPTLLSGFKAPCYLPPGLTPRVKA